MSETPEAEGELIESGAFRVDRARALDKLMRFQLPDPNMFLLSWIRSAVASKAPSIDVSMTGSELLVGFGGDPFSLEELSEPYAFLFERRDQAHRRNRDLAIGILTAMRLKPKVLTVDSGAGEKRVRLRIQSLSSEAAEPLMNSQTATVIRMPLDGLSLDPRLLRESIRLRCAMVPVPIRFRTQAAEEAFLPGRAQGDPRSPSQRVEGEGLRGAVRVPPRGAPESVLHFYTLGVYAATARRRLPACQVLGELDDDLLTLNASQTGAVRNARFEKAWAAAAGAAERLAAQAAGAHRALLEEALRESSSPSFARLWRAAILAKSGEADAPLEGLRELAASLLHGSELDPKSEERIRTAAYRTGWLREACCSILSSRSRDARAGLEKSLWTAPLLLAAGGPPLSLHDLASQEEWLGYVPYVSRPFPELHAAFAAVRLVFPEELEFLRRFFRELKDVTDSLQRMSRRPASALTASLTDIGVVDLLIRESLGQGLGEVALSQQLPAKGSRLHYFREGRPYGSAALETPLRFCAAMNRPQAPGRVADGAYAGTAVAQALPLYRKVAEEYQPDGDWPRNSAIREHLLDYLDWALRPEGAAPEGAWILGVPIFGPPSARLSARSLQEAVRAGRTVYFSQGPEGERPFRPSILLREARPLEALLRRLLAEAKFAPAPGLEGVQMAFKPGGDALAALQGGTLPPPEGEAGLALLLSLLRERGSFAREPGQPARGLILRLALKNFCPWPGQGVLSEVRQALLDQWEHQPMFRASRPDGRDWTLVEMARLLAAGRTPSYRPEAGGAEADLVLDERELALARALCPSSAGPRPCGARRTAVQASSPAEDAPAGAMAFEARMAASMALEGDGLRALFGLPEEALPGLSATIHADNNAGRVARTPPGYRFLLNPPGQPLAATALLDVSNWPGPVVQTDGGPAAPLEAAVLRLALAFFRALADQRSKAPAASDGADPLLVYFLQLLQPPRSAEPPPGWGELRARLRGLPLIPVSDGSRLSLDELAARGASGESVEYLPEKPPARAPGRPLPILAFPRLTAMAAGRISLALHAAESDVRESAPHAPIGTTPAERLSSALAALLADLQGRRGVLPKKLEGVLETRLAGAADGSAALTRTILASGLEPPIQAAYLASMRFTRLNREMDGLTDGDDVRFQKALIERMAKSAQGGGSDGRKTA